MIRAWAKHFIHQRQSLNVTGMHFVVQKHSIESAGHISYMYVGSNYTNIIQRFTPPPPKKPIRALYKTSLAI